MTMQQQRLQEAADEEEFGSHIEHFDCARYLASVEQVGVDPIVFGMRGDEVCFAVYDGLVGDSFSDYRTNVAEYASNYGLAILYASLLRRRITPDALPYAEINGLKMSAGTYKQIMTGPVYSFVRNYMRRVGVEVVNDADSFLIQ